MANRILSARGIGSCANRGDSGAGTASSTCAFRREERSNASPPPTICCSSSRPEPATSASVPTCPTRGAVSRSVPSASSAAGMNSNVSRGRAAGPKPSWWRFGTSARTRIRSMPSDAPTRCSTCTSASRMRALRPCSSSCARRSNRDARRAPRMAKRFHWHSPPVSHPCAPARRARIDASLPYHRGSLRAPPNTSIRTFRSR